MQGLLSPSQAKFKDIMILRQLYLTRRHMLHTSRDALIASTRDPQEPRLHPSETVIRMADLANQLKDNASADQKLLYQMSRAFYCGVGRRYCCDGSVAV